MKVQIQVPKSLHRALALEAEAEGVDLETYALSLLAHAHGTIQGAMKSMAEVRRVLTDGFGQTEERKG